MRSKLRSGCTLVVVLVAWGALWAVPDLWIRDDPADTGAEPNNSSPILYLSDDIWVRRAADPNYDPQPFPCASPTWTPLPHQGPCYRDPKASSPNYIYVRVRNRGTTTSSGTETLHVYWSKASTGLVWPTHWNDYLASICPGPPRLYGYEVTKPRRNAATVSATVRNDYVNAVQTIDTAAFQFPDLSTYFDKQNQVHNTLFFTGIHTSLRFLPWHRELLARYEALLREVKPELTLLYYDWTVDPSPTIIGPTGFMGASNGAVGAPFASFGISRSKSSLTPSAFASGLSPTYQANTLLMSSSYSSFWTNIEGPTHNQAHNYVSGTLASLNAAADPLFFMLHANCDRVWALWQRRNVSRWAPATAYDASQSNAAITSSMRPWNGTDGISPWITTNFPSDPNGYAIQKAPTHHSIVFPPIYDDALLTIPPIPPNQCAIIEIPFYPPPAAECTGFSDPQHLCLLARIQPITSSPPEGSALWQNVKNHNNIAWRNVNLSDCNTGPFFLVAPGRIGAAGQLIRNVRDTPARLALRFVEADVAFRSLFQYGAVRLRLDKNLLEAWERGGRRGRGIEVVGDEILIFQTEARLDGIEMDANEMGRMDLALELRRDYEHPAGNIFHLDVLQYDERSENEPVGGLRYDLDFNLLAVVPKGSEWQYLDGGEQPPANWMELDFDGRWRTGTAPFAYGRPDAATSLRGRDERPATAYFRRVFEVPDPSFYRNLSLGLQVDDGIAVYLNGKEIHRANLPGGPLGPGTPALAPVTGAAAQACRSVDISNSLGALVTGRNVLAAEVHAARQGNPEDIGFDLELGANVPDLPRQPPVVVIARPPMGAVLPVGKEVAILADVVDADRNLADVRIFFDGELVHRGVDPPFEALIPPPRRGRHRVSVEATDQTRLTARREAIFTVVDNLPPLVEITVEHESVYEAGEPILLTAIAGDEDGVVVKVTFFVASLARSHFPEGKEIIEAGSDDAPPYEVEVRGLAPGPYYVFAQATDDDGAIGHSTLLPHIHVRESAEATFIRGDSNCDGQRNIGDPVYSLNWQFRQGPTPCCLDAVDINDDGRADISDAIYDLSFQFRGGPGPPAPGGTCGPDPTADRLDCAAFPPCRGGEHQH
jgi:hypothetical protein